MNILGLNSAGYSTAVALLVDGDLVFAAEEERLIREMVKLRGGPSKLKLLLKEYEGQLKELTLEMEEYMRMRDLIIQLTSVEEEDEEEES